MQNKYNLEKRSRKSLKGKLVALCALPVFVFGGCSGFYGHPAINATMGLLPEIAQPGGYKDYKNSERNEERNKEIRELRKEILRLKLRNNQIPEFKEGDVYQIKDTIWIKQANGKWSTPSGSTLEEEKILYFANNSGKPIIREKEDGTKIIIYRGY